MSGGSKGRSVSPSVAQGIFVVCLLDFEFVGVLEGFLALFTRGCFQTSIPPSRPHAPMVGSVLGARHAVWPSNRS